METDKYKAYTMKPRSITDILIQADNATGLHEISSAWDEIKANLRSYPIIEIEFALEHLTGITGKIGRKEGEYFRQFFELLNSTGK